MSYSSDSTFSIKDRRTDSENKQRLTPSLSLQSTGTYDAFNETRDGCGILGGTDLMGSGECNSLREHQDVMLENSNSNSSCLGGGMGIGGGGGMGMGNNSTNRDGTTSGSGNGGLVKKLSHLRTTVNQMNYLSQKLLPSKYNKEKVKWEPILLGDDSVEKNEIKDDDNNNKNILEEEEEEKAKEKKAKKNCKKLKIVSYNVWSIPHNWLNRAHFILEILQQENPDIICLQEVTPRFLDYLKFNVWIQEQYYLSDMVNARFVPMGNLILSKLPFDNVGFPPHMIQFPRTLMSRNFIIVKIHVNEKPIYLVNIHLESDYNGTGCRIQQLRFLFDVLTNNEFLMLNHHQKTKKNSHDDSSSSASSSSSSQQQKQVSFEKEEEEGQAGEVKMDHAENVDVVDDIIIAGAFNFDHFSLEKCYIDKAYIDIWSTLHKDPDSGGNTTDGRTDKILLYSKNAFLQPKEIHRFGGSMTKDGKNKIERTLVETDVEKAKKKLASIDSMTNDNNDNYNNNNNNDNDNDNDKNENLLYINFWNLKMEFPTTDDKNIDEDQMIAAENAASDHLGLSSQFIVHNELKSLDI